MHLVLSILTAALSVSAVPFLPAGNSAEAQHESRSSGLDIPVPLGPLGAIDIGAFKPDGTVDLCANVSKEALGALTQALSTVDLGIDVTDLLGPLGPFVTGVEEALPADITVGALNEDGTATVCANIPGKRYSEIFAPKTSPAYGSA